MLPPGCIVLYEKPFFFYDYINAADKQSMNSAHYHNFFEIYFLVSGTCDYLIDNKVYSISSNSLILIPSDMIHKTVYTSNKHERIVLNFNELMFDSCLLNDLHDVKYCHLQGEQLSDLQNLFHKMSNIADYKIQRNRILLSCYLNELIINMIENNKSIAHTYVEQPLPIDAAINYISNHYNEEITLKAFAKQFNYSADHFSRIFKKSTGSSFKEYLLLTRLSAAEKLLLTTKRAINDIAFSCGFNDSNYFTYMFAKKYGISPLKYRNEKNKV